MTTGRINQVTIFGQDRAREGTVRAAPPEGPEAVIGRNGKTPRPTPKVTPLGGSRGHPLAPDEFPKTWSAAGTRAAREGIDGPAACRPREEVPRTPVTAMRRILGGTDPRNLRKCLANGQQSTDLNRPGRLHFPAFGRSASYGDHHDGWLPRAGGALPHG
jgi:hypothetical protein